MPYIGVSPQFGVRRKHTYTATTGQTSFSGAGSEGATLSYKDSTFVDVYQNGIKLGDADYTSTSGTAIVLTQGASVDDLVEIIVFDVFSAADTVSKADGGTFDGAVTFSTNVGIGNARTDGTLHVHSGSAGTVSADSTSDDLVVENSDQCGITIISPDDASARIRFTSPSTNTQVGGAAIFYRQNINKMNVGTAVAGGILDLQSGAGVSAINADADGIVTMPKQPIFIASADATISLSTSFAETTAFANAQVNIGTHYNTSNGRFTAPVAGTYQFAVASIGGAPSTVYRYRIYKNGSSLHNYSYRIDTTSGGGNQYGTNGEYCIVTTLAASDYISIFAKSDDGSDAYAASAYRYSYFRGHLIG